MRPAPALCDKKLETSLTSPRCCRLTDLRSLGAPRASLARSQALRPSVPEAMEHHVHTHLVGSLPFADARTAMLESLERLGDTLLYLPDGETGERRDFIIHLGARLAHNPALRGRVRDVIIRTRRLKLHRCEGCGSARHGSSRASCSTMAMRPTESACGSSPRRWDSSPTSRAIAAWVGARPRSHARCSSSCGDWPTKHPRRTHERPAPRCWPGSLR